MCSRADIYILHINIPVYKIYNIYVRCIDTLENKVVSLSRWYITELVVSKWMCSPAATDFDGPLAEQLPQTEHSTFGTAASSPLIPSSCFD